MISLIIFRLLQNIFLHRAFNNSTFNRNCLQNHLRRPWKVSFIHLFCLNFSYRVNFFPFVTLETLGSFSIDDGDGSESVAKKMNLRSFKLNRVYLDPLNM